MRKVKVYSTAFGLKAINSAATTWGELQADLSTNNVTFGNMNAVENVGNTTLVLKEAKLPEGEFVLMLTPQKTKSGSDYKTVRATVVSIITTYGVPAKEHFNSGNKNYTNKSAAELMVLISSWNEQHTKPTVKVSGIVTPKLELSTPAPKPIVEKMSFVEALKFVLTYDEINEYEDLESYIQDAIDILGDNSSSVEGLSEEEKSWINKIKNM
jgi:hypothetical protein